jgi:hypothetical protein
MTDLTIICNNVPRDIVDGFELSADEREWFDYVDWQAVDRGEDSGTFFRYRGTTYDVSEFLYCNDSSPFTGWDGYLSDTFFSGILVRYVEDNERIIVGRYYA